MFLKIKNIAIILIIFIICFSSCANYKDNIEKVNKELDKIEKELDNTEKELDKTGKSLDNLKDKIKEKTSEITDFFKNLKQDNNSTAK